MTMNLFIEKLIGEKRRRRNPAMIGECLSSACDHFRIVPIRSDTAAPHLCHQGRVLVFSRHATFHQFSHYPEGRQVEAILLF